MFSALVCLVRTRPLQVKSQVCLVLITSKDVLSNLSGYYFPGGQGNSGVGSLVYF